MNRLLIRDATIVSVDPTVGNLRRASILAENGRIVAIRPDVRVSDAHVIDADGMIAIPGLIDAHRHTWQSPLSMVAADADLNSYFSEIPRRLAPAYEAQDVEIANRIGALQALETGVTTLFDWCHVLHTPDHADAAIEGLRTSGIRAVFGYGFPNTEPAWSMDSERPVPDDVRRVRRELLPSSDGRVTMAMAIRGPEQSTLDVTQYDIEVARELGLRISTHVGNGAFSVPYRSIERMYDAELLGPDIQYVHCNSLTDESIRRIADSGGMMVSTPTVETQMQFGYPATSRFLAAGIRPALGVDVVTSTDCGLFGQMACAFQVARLQALECDTPSISTFDTLKFATLDGATSLGLEGEIGSLSPGKQADIVLLKPPRLTVVNDPVGYAVLCADSTAVDTVVVSGAVVKRAGKLLGVDSEALNNELTSCGKRLFEKAKFVTPIELFR